MNFQKFQVKWKIVKDFARLKQRTALRNLSRLPTFHPHQIKPYYVFFKEIYRNIQIFAFKLLQECSSWASRNGLVQIFETTQSKFAGKFVKSERFLGVFRVHTIFSVKWVKVRKMSEVFLANVWSFFLASFCWLLDFLLEILKLKKKSMMMSKVLYSKTCPKHYFQKKIFWSKFRLFGDCFRTL